MNITQYISQLNTRFKSGISREHFYRTDLESLIRELVQGVEITNEPANVTDCGNPDYVITRKKIPIGYIEAKDIDKDLKNKATGMVGSRVLSSGIALIVSIFTL